MSSPCAQNPALRHELSFEMGQMHSDMHLHFGNDSKTLGPMDDHADAVSVPVHSENQKCRGRKAELWEMGMHSGRFTGQ